MNAGIAGRAGALVARLASGAVTVDLGIGRRVRTLGPFEVAIQAGRDLVFEVIAAPYLGRTPGSLGSSIEVLERSSDMVLALHRTPVGQNVVTTLETVRFRPPEEVAFRLVRGPVPHVVERFRLSETGPGTTLRYEGELAVDLWRFGRWWGSIVAGRWESAVRFSMEHVREISEMRAQAAHRRSDVPGSSSSVERKGSESRAKGPGD